MSRIPSGILPWAVTAFTLGLSALLLRQGSRPLPLFQPLGNTRPSRLRIIAGHPLTFGIGSGIVGGSIAAIRNKPVSVAANIVTALVVGISEGMLVADPKRATETAVLTMIGTMTGMAPFTRWQKGKPALVERRTQTQTPVPPALTA